MDEKGYPKKSFGKIMAEMFTGTENQAQRIVNCIEKMLDTTPNSAERVKAKRELVDALLRK